MPRFRPILIGAVALAAVALTANAGSAATPAQKCAAAKLDAAARAITAHVSCQARALQTGKPVRAGCHESADARLDAAFAKAEARGGCTVTGEEGAVDAAVDSLVDALLATQVPGRCGATKVRLAAQKAAGTLACHRVAARRGVEPAPACLQNAVDRFLVGFARADKKAGCKATGDASAVAALVDGFVAETTALLLGTSPANPAPTNLAAAVDGDDVALTWSAPDPASGKTHVRVLRRLNAPPSDASDPAASVVVFGTATAATDPLTGLWPTTSETARTYHYAAFGCTAGGDCESTGSRTTLAPTLVQALRAGGYVLHWRHAAADVCSDNLGLGTAATTMSPDWWKSCDANCGTATARQMSATGVTQATTIGSEFDRLEIPIGRVVSSEYCRNFKTAELMDFGPTTELRQDLTYFVYDEANRCSASYAIIDEPPAAGTNTAIIGHAGFTGTCPVLGVLAWGEAAIFKTGTGDSDFVTRILADDWDDF